MVTIGDIVKEKFLNEEPVADIVNNYNKGLEQIQNQFLDQRDAINYIKMSTHHKDVVNDMVDTLKFQMSDTQNNLNNTMNIVQKDMNNKASYDHVNTLYAKKDEVANKFTEYARHFDVDSKFSELNTKISDVYLPKSVANTMYANKSEVGNMKNNINRLEDKQSYLRDDLDQLSKVMPSFATKSDLTSYARYTDFVDLGNNFSANVQDMNKNYQTVSDFIGVQSDINKSFLDKDIVLQSDILYMKNNHDALVNELGKYMNADAVTNLLHNSYTPLDKFNALDKDVIDLREDVNNLGLRTNNIETNLKIKDSMLCLADPVRKNDVCLVGGDFALLKDIMNDYYAGQEGDSQRLAALEKSRAESEKILASLNKQLEESERKRIEIEEANKNAREAIRKEAIAKDEELNAVLTNAIYKVQQSTQSATEDLKTKLVIEEANIKKEQGKVSVLNTQLMQLQEKLKSVETQDMIQDKAINEMKDIIESFEEQKKKLNDTIDEQKFNISKLNFIVAEQESTITKQNFEIIDQEGKVKTCLEDKFVCNNKLSKCDNDLFNRNNIISGNELKLLELQGTAIQLNNEKMECNEMLKSLTSDCSSKISLDQCDNQDRRIYKMALYENDNFLFNTDIITRVADNTVDQSRLLDAAKSKKMTNMYDSLQHDNPSLAERIKYYSSTNTNFKWGDGVSECKDYSQEILTKDKLIARINSDLTKCRNQNM